MRVLERVWGAGCGVQGLVFREWGVYPFRGPGRNRRRGRGLLGSRARGLQGLGWGGLGGARPGGQALPLVVRRGG